MKAPLPGLLRDEAVARFTAARLGGKADFLYIARKADYSDTLTVLDWAWAQAMPVTVLGGGANVLVADAGIRGLTIINRATAIKALPPAAAPRVEASAGSSLIRLARFCQDNRLSGMEWAIAVPGTVGGAVVNNAGAHGGDISGILRRARVYEHGQGIVEYDAADLRYAYRSSRLKQREDKRFFVLNAELTLAWDKRDAIQERMEKYKAHRRATQPPGASLGSIFKNPPGDYAGRLIEAAGLKGTRVGAVMVSPLHANFFLTLDETASARDYWQLIRQVRAAVAADCGVQLELEIQTVGDWRGFAP